MYEHMQPGKKRDAKERGKKEKRNTRIYIYQQREREKTSRAKWDISTSSHAAEVHALN